MSIITRIRSSVKPTLRPTAATVVLFDGGSRRKSPGFGKGLLRSLPSYAAPFTAEDAAWWAAESAAAEDREFDRLADIAAFEDRYSRGFASL